MAYWESMAGKEGWDMVHTATQEMAAKQNQVELPKPPKEKKVRSRVSSKTAESGKLASQKQKEKMAEMKNQARDAALRPLSLALY